jgi:hypothetical protein
VEEAGARGWVVVHAGEKPAMAGTQDRPSSDAAMTFIVVWFGLLNDAATTGADGSGTRNSKEYLIHQIVFPAASPPSSQ